MSDYNLGTARGRIVIDFDDAASKKAKETIQDTGDEAEKTSKKVDNLNESLNNIATGLLTAGTAMAAGVGLAVNAAGDFEFSISAIKAVSGATADQIDAISEKALQLGRDTAYGANEAAGAMEELAKAGIPLEDIINSAADATVSLAAAGQIDLAEAAAITAASMNQFKLSAEDVTGIADTFAGAANASATGVREIGLAMSQAGPAAKAAGLSLEETAAGVALLANNGIDGFKAGTQLRSILTNLQPASKQAGEAMKELGLITEDGTNAFYNQDGTIKDLRDIIGTLNGAFGDLTEEQTIAYSKVIFGTESLSAISAIASTTAGDFDNLTAAINGTSAADVAAERLNNMNGQFTILKGSIETAAITIGTNLLPQITEMVKTVTEWVNKFASLDGSIQNVIIRTVAITSGVLLFSGVALKAGLEMAKLRTSILAVAGAQTIFGKSGAIATVVTKSMAAAQKIYNAVMSANPILRIVTIILLVVAALITLAGGWDEVKKAFQPVMDTMMDAGKKLLPVISQLADTFMGLITTLIDKLMPIIMDLATTLFPVIMDVIDALIPIIVLLVDVLGDVLPPVLELVGTLLEALAPVISALLEALMPLIDLLLKALVPVIEAVAWVLEKLAEGLQWVVDWVKDFFTETDDGTSKAGDAWQSFMDRVQPIIDWFQTYVAPVIQAVIDFIVAAFQTWWQTVTTVWTAVWNTIQAFLDWYMTNVAPVIQAVVDLIVAIFQTWWEAVSAVWQWVWDKITAFLNWWMENVAPVIQAVVDLIVAIFQLWWEIVSAVWQWVWDKIQAFLDWFNANVVPPIQAVITAVTNIFTGVRDTIVGVFTAIWNKVQEVVTWVVDHITANWELLKGIVEGIFDAVQDKIEEPLQDAMDFIEGIKDTVVDAFEGAGEWLLDAGKKIIEGLKKGIEDTLGSIKDTLGNLTDSITSWKGPPKRDAKLLTPAGKLIMQSLIDGFQGEYGAVKRTMQDLTDMIPASVSTSISASIAGNAVLDKLSTGNRTLVYNAAAGTGQVDGESALITALRQARGIDAGWGATA